jgi:hypothetical protein
MATNDVFQIVLTDDPAFAPKGRAQQITENHSRVEGGVCGIARTTPPPGAQVLVEHHRRHKPSVLTREHSTIPAR